MNIKWLSLVALLPVALLAAAADGQSKPARDAPPYTDYCAMLAQEIQGRKHAFLAGNLVYYVGGRYNCWKHHEDETLGLTHPFHHDLRGRGFGLAQHEGSGYGHDFRGWEFYTQTKAAYGTVIIGDKSYRHPVPESMQWRPDKVVCRYKVGDVTIHEEKFIAAADVVCSIITADAPVTLRFEGHSLVIPKLSAERTSKVDFDRTNNAVHVTEGGTVITHPVKDETVTGKLIYDGMSTVLSSSAKLSGYAKETDNEGRQLYRFDVPCDDRGVAITWAMDDRYADALKRTKSVLADYRAALSAKTRAMNDLLNYQIPYFRCSDRDVVDVYYYLWAIYLMYYIDVQQGWEMWPHTQTAVNNFLGMHRYDANFQIKVGAWTADKDYYAYGNVLHWKPLLPYARRMGSLPDNKGIAWFSPVWGTTTEHVIGAWQIYRHTGDVRFLHDCYDDYFKLLFKDGMHSHWGCHYDAAECLRRMALLTGDTEDPDRWLKMVRIDDRRRWLDAMWQSRWPNYFGGGQRMGWSGFACLRNSYFPEDWAYRMTQQWAVDSERGFFWTVPLSTVARQDFEHVSDVFTSTPDTNYYAIAGMYNCHVGPGANVCALAHLKGYNMKWNIPIAPEAWSKEPAPWGDQYSNFNAGKILLILEGIAGLDYSIPESTLSVCDNMPEQWSSMEVRVPIKLEGKMRWPRVVYRRTLSGNAVRKTIAVTGNPLENLQIQPWLEEGTVATAPDGYTTKDQGRNHIGYRFKTAGETSVTIEINKSEVGPPE
ncbi:MAG: hypothetical protein HQ567_18935 [Candidatus Nealsonbacteria bacterium]|nr:hypothetical protein [Candidatus Nealsonbacteria bacterium]